MKEVYEKFKDELLNSCVPFWLNNGVDKKYGGVLTCLDRIGKVYSTDKSVWMQGRCGWMFSYIYNHIEKNPEYLRFAKSVYPVLRHHQSLMLSLWVFLREISYANTSYHHSFCFILATFVIVVNHAL